MSRARSIEDAAQTPRVIARWLARALILIAVCVLLARIMPTPRLHLPAQFVAMRPNTAIAFFLAGIGLLCVAGRRVVDEVEGSARQSLTLPGGAVLGIVCGALVSLIGVGTLAEYLFGIDLHIDALFFSETAEAAGSYFAGRMPELSALNLFCLGAGLALFFRRSVSRFAQALIFAGALGTLIAVMGHLYGFNPIHADARYAPVAVHAALAFLLLCIGIFCARPDCRFMQLCMSQGVSGTMVRRLCPAAILLPLIGGWLRLLSHRQAIFSPELETLIFSLTNISMFAGLVAWIGWFLFRAEESKMRVEGALNQSLRRYVFLADSLPQIIWTARPDGGLDYYNKAWYQYTGLSFEETKDWGWGPVLHPDDLGPCVARWTESVRTGEPYEVEYRFKRAADGASRWHLGRALPMRDGQGVITQWVGTCTDIHEQKSAKEKLERHVAARTAELSVANAQLQAHIVERERAERRNAQIFAHSLDVICTIDETGCFTQVSAAARDVWGYEPEELVGRRYIDLVHPEDHAKTNECASQIMSGEAATDFENRYIRKDGSLVPMNWSANWSALEKTMFCVAHDMADRHESTEQLRASEERFRSVAQSLGDAIISADAGGSIIFWNQAAESIFGHSAVEVLGQPLALIMPERFREMHRRGMARHQATGEARVIGQTVELEGLHKDGREFPIELSLSTWQTAEGRFYTGIVRDITLRKKIKEELHEAKEAAEAASLAKSEFLANVSHEIRTPLNGILGMTDLALDLELSAEARKHLGVVKTSGLSLLGLLNDLLDFSKIEAGQLHFEEVPFDLQRCLENIAMPLRNRAQNKGLALLLRIDPAIASTVVGDPTRLGQVITNLADNAIKFTAAGSVTIEVQQVAERERHLALEFSVTDTGIGIPLDKQELIFQAFAQADGSTTRHYGGTGLGLGICARLVERMRGKLKVESEIGRGSKFHFVARFGAVDGPAPVAPPPVSIETEPPRGGLRILVAEDNAVNREVVLGLLERAGHHLAPANDGHEAVSLYRRERFDVVLMDVQMPSLDGFAATSEIRKLERQLGRRTPIVAMTAHAMAGDEARCLAAGMDGYLSKPLTRQGLLAVIAKVLPQAAETLTASPAPAASPGWDGLLEHFEGESALLERLSVIFLETTPPALEAMRSAAAERNAPVLAQLAHSLLSSVGVFGAKAAVAIALQLEDAGRRADFTEVPEQLNRLQDETDRLLATLANGRVLAQAS